MFIVLGILVLCFVIPAVMYPSAFTRPRPLSKAEQRSMDEGREQYLAKTQRP
jgi:hypothetical protein